jgi:hypothetical protein
MRAIDMRDPADKGTPDTSTIDDRQVIELMLKATGEDYDESEAWKLRLFVDYMNAAAKIKELQNWSKPDA